MGDAKRKRGNDDPGVAARPNDKKHICRQHARLLLDGIFVPYSVQAELMLATHNEPNKVLSFPYAFYFEPNQQYAFGIFVLFGGHARYYYYNEKNEFVRGEIRTCKIGFHIPEQCTWTVRTFNPSNPRYFTKGEYLCEFDAKNTNIIVQDSYASIFQEQIVKDKIVAIQQKGILDAFVVTENNGNHYLISLRGPTITSTCIVVNKIPQINQGNIADKNANAAAVASAGIIAPVASKEFVVRPFVKLIARPCEKIENLLSFSEFPVRMETQSTCEFIRSFEMCLWDEVREQKTLLPSNLGVESLLLSKVQHVHLTAKWMNFLFHVLQLETMERMYNIQIELLNYQWTIIALLKHYNKMVSRGYDTTPQIMFHGVRVERSKIEQAVQEIKQFGFDVSYSKNCVHGSGGIYASPQITCALEYTHKDKDNTAKLDQYNYFFVCLTIPGNVVQNGKQNQPMKEEQTAWMTLVPPNKIFCIVTDAVLPVACVKFKLHPPPPVPPSSHRT